MRSLKDALNEIDGEWQDSGEALSINFKGFFRVWSSLQFTFCVEEHSRFTLNADVREDSVDSFTVKELFGDGLSWAG